MKLAIACMLSGVALAAGCAAQDPRESRRPTDDNAFITGSRIPKREGPQPGVLTLPKEAAEAATNPAQPARNPL